MSEILIYSGPGCPYCVRAKQLLDSKGAKYTEYNVRADDQRRAEMLAKSNGMRTIPQIFINGQHIGGCDELHALDAAGKLDPLLKAH